MARISYIGDNGEPLEMVVGEDNPEVMVGRHRSCGIRTSTQSVSRQHARVFFDGDHYWLQDNGSSNGTFYQNNRLSPQDPVALDDGEFFMCGNFEMRFDLDEDDLRRGQGQSSQGYEDTIDEVIDYGDEEPEATQFSDIGDWDEPGEMDIPPPPGGAIPPPPADDIPPPPAADYDDDPEVIDFEPLPLEPMVAHDAELIEGLRAEIDQRLSEIGDRDAKIQGLEIELESLSKRVEAGQGNEQQVGALQAEVEQLRVVAGEVGQLREEFEKACEDADTARDEADKALTELDETRSQLEEVQVQAQQLQAGSEAAQQEIDSLRDQLATAGSAAPAVDEAAIAQLQLQLDTAQHDLEHAQEKYEEARAGRRNAEELAGLLRSQNDAGQAGRKALEDQVAALKAAAKAPSGGGGDVVSSADFDALSASLATANAELGTLRAEIDRLRTELAAERERADAASANAGDSAAADSRVTELEGQLAAMSEQLAGAGAAGDSEEMASLREELEQAQADRDDLEHAQSANMKRIKKLLKDLDEARKQGGGAAGGGDDAALRAEIGTLKAAVTRAEAAVEEARSNAAAGGRGDLTRKVSDLNGAVSSFRSDFMQLTDAFEQIRSGDAEEQADGLEMMVEGLETCSARNADLKRLVRELRDAVG